MFRKKLEGPRGVTTLRVQNTNRKGEYYRGRRSGRSRSISGSPKRASVFSRIRRDRSESPRSRMERKGRRDGGVFNRKERVWSNQARKKTLPAWKQQEAGRKQNFDRMGDFKNQQRSERKRNKFTLLTKSPREILALDKCNFKTPPLMTTPVEKRNNNKFCEFHREVGHNTDECMHLKRQIKELIKVGKLSHVIKELKQISRRINQKRQRKEKHPERISLCKRSRKRSFDDKKIGKANANLFYGYGARLILTNSEGAEFTYALRFRFDATNNESKYEALIADLRSRSKWNLKKTITEEEVLVVVEEEASTWMNPIYEYLTKETLPEEKEKAKDIWRKSGRMHAGPRSVVAKALRMGYYWPTIHVDARKVIQECQDYEIEEIPHVLWARRTMIKSSNGDTPFSLIYGRETIIPAEISMPTLRTAEIDMVQNDEALEINLDLLEERREQATIHEAGNKARWKSTTTQRSAAQASNKKTLCMETMTPATQRIADSLALNGKDHTK
nr:reverse transcriptase domain-containing protein [Tanacetum cinerariifolium]